MGMLIKRNMYGFEDFFNFRDEFYKKEDTESFTYIKYVPGVKKDNIKITFDNDVMNININGHELIDDYKVEYNSFISPKLDIDSAEATVENGILSVKFKKVNKSKTLKIK